MYQLKYRLMVWQHVGPKLTTLPTGKSPPSNPGGNLSLAFDQLSRLARAMEHHCQPMQQPLGPTPYADQAMTRSAREQHSGQIPPAHCP